MGAKHLEAMWDSIDNHYHFSDGHLGGIKGYEFYAKLEKTYSKLQADNEAEAKAIEFFRSLHAAELRPGARKTALYPSDGPARAHDRDVRFGGLPYPKLEKSFSSSRKRYCHYSRTIRHSSIPKNLALPRKPRLASNS